VAQVLELLRAGLEHGRRWFRPVIDTSFGVVAWLRGEFAAARSHLEAATADETAVDQHEIDAVWFLPEEPIATARIYLALVGLVRGDLVGADAELAQAARRAEQLGVPQGAWSLAYARLVESWLRIEAGRLDRATAGERARRHSCRLSRVAARLQPRRPHQCIPRR
jgi:hypothetical protein